MFILVLRKKRAFTYTFQLFPLILKTRKFCLVVVFPFFALLCLFAYLFILHGQVMFFITPTSAACLVQGPVTVPGLWPCKHTELEGFAALCILPWCISAGTRQFSRCYKGLETCYWEEQLAACVSQKRPGPAWCSCCSERRRLSPGWGEEGALALGRCWIIIPVLPAQAFLGKFSLKARAKPGACWAHCCALLQGSSQPLWAWPENRKSPSFPKASFPLS